MKYDSCTGLKSPACNPSKGLGAEEAGRYWLGPGCIPVEPTAHIVKGSVLQHQDDNVTNLRKNSGHIRSSFPDLREYSRIVSSPVWDNPWSIIDTGGTMNTNDILVAIDAEISRLQQARTLLSDTSPIGKRQPGRPAGSSMPGKVKAKRTLSAEAREKIAAAQRARWAKSKRAAKKVASSSAAIAKKSTAARSPAKQTAKRTMSAGARAKIAAAQKARWAKVRKAAKKTSPAKKAVSTKSSGAKKEAPSGPAAAATPVTPGS